MSILERRVVDAIETFVPDGPFSRVARNHACGRGAARFLLAWDRHGPNAAFVLDRGLFGGFGQTAGRPRRFVLDRPLCLLLGVLSDKLEACLNGGAITGRGA